MIKFSLIAILLFYNLVAVAQNRVVVVPLNGASQAVEKKIENIIWVAKSGGDFSSPNEAMDSIQMTGANNRYLINVAPGNYLISHQLVMRPYVSVVGSGPDLTIFESRIAGEAGATVEGGTNSEISNLSIKSNYTSQYPSAILVNCTSTCGLKNVVLDIRNTSTTRSVTAVSVDGPATTLNVDASTLRAFGNGDSQGLSIFMASAVVKNSNISGQTGIYAGHDGNAQIRNTFVSGGFPIFVNDDIPNDFAVINIENSVLAFRHTAVTNKVPNGNKIRIFNTVFSGDVTNTTNGDSSIKCVFSSTNDAEELGADCRPVAR